MTRLEDTIRQRRPLALEYRRPGQGSLPGWRAFALKQIVSAEALDGRFSLAPGFNPAAPRYRGGIVECVESDEPR